MTSIFDIGLSCASLLGGARRSASLWSNLYSASVFRIESKTLRKKGEGGSTQWHVDMKRIHTLQYISNGDGTYGPAWIDRGVMKPKGM